MKELLWRIGRWFRWMPIVWNTRAWDYQYTLNLMRYHLLEVAECLENGITASGKEDAKKIRYVCALIKRLDDGSAWDMSHDYKKAQELEETYWNEIWDTVRKYGRGWWD